jgi:hypothetical protein
MHVDGVSPRAIQGQRKGWSCWTDSMPPGREAETHLWDPEGELALQTKALVPPASSKGHRWLCERPAIMLSLI